MVVGEGLVGRGGDEAHVHCAVGVLAEEGDGGEEAGVDDMKGGVLDGEREVVRGGGGYVC